MFSKHLRFYSASLLLSLAAGAAQAAEPLAAINAVPGKPVCHAAPASIDGKPVAAKVCVIGGSFSSDRYALILNGTVIVQGIDDQTTEGVAGSFDGQPVMLRCVPQSLYPKATPEETQAEVRRILPNASPEKVVETATDVPAMGLELGRICTATRGAQALMAVQVLFD